MIMARVYLLTIFVTLICQPLLTIAQMEMMETLLAGYDICAFTCVSEIYEMHCGGASCVYSASSSDQYGALCSDACAQALASEKMLKCLVDNDSARKDMAGIQDFLVNKVADFCSEPLAEGSKVAVIYLENDNDLEE